MSKDYYKTIGCEKTATQEELKKAYRKLAHKYHPDKETGDEAKFKEINEAYQVLKDEEKRKKYDQYGTSFEQMGGWGGGHNWEDIMQGFRGGGGGFSGQANVGGFSFDLGDIFSEFFGGGGGRGSARSRGSITTNWTCPRRRRWSAMTMLRPCAYAVRRSTPCSRIRTCRCCWTSCNGCTTTRRAEA